MMINNAYEDNLHPPAPDAARMAAHADTTLYLNCPDLNAACTYLRTHGDETPTPKIACYGMRKVYLRPPTAMGSVCNGPSPRPLFNIRLSGA